jgi:hypothetical protein
VPTIGPERQRLDPHDRSKVKLAIKVRKERTSARRLPFQVVAELAGIDTRQQQVALTGEMLRGGFNDLRGGGKMEKPSRRSASEPRNTPVRSASRHNEAGQIL